MGLDFDAWDKELGATPPAAPAAPAGGLDFDAWDAEIGANTAAAPASGGLDFDAWDSELADTNRDRAINEGDSSRAPEQGMAFSPITGFVGGGKEDIGEDGSLKPTLRRLGGAVAEEVKEGFKDIAPGLRSGKVIDEATFKNATDPELLDYYQRGASLNSQRVEELQVAGVPYVEAIRQAGIEGAQQTQAGFKKAETALEGAFPVDPSYAGKSSGKVEDVVRGVSRSLPGMAATVANPVAGMGILHEQIAGQSFKENEAKGADPYRNAVAANVSAAIQTPLESAGNLLAIGAIKRAFGGNALAAKAADLFKVGGGEALENVLQGFPEDIANYWTNNPESTLNDAAKATGNDPELMAKTWERAWQGAAGGLLLAGSGQTAGSVYDASRRMLKKPDAQTATPPSLTGAPAAPAAELLPPETPKDPATTGFWNRVNGTLSSAPERQMTSDELEMESTSNPAVSAFVKTYNDLVSGGHIDLAGKLSITDLGRDGDLSMALKQDGLSPDEKNILLAMAAQNGLSNNVEGAAGRLTYVGEGATFAPIVSTTSSTNLLNSSAPTPAPQPDTASSLRAGDPSRLNATAFPGSSQGNHLSHEQLGAFLTDTPAGQALSATLAELRANGQNDLADKIQITSANAGGHAPNSRHYKGQAVDINSKALTTEEQAILAGVAQRNGLVHDVAGEPWHFSYRGQTSGNAATTTAAPDFIQRAASLVGEDPNYLAKNMQAESNGNVNAKATTSSATGLFQFTDGTWKAMVGRYGQEFGLTMDGRGDQNQQAVAAALFTRDNRQALRQSLGREPSDGDLYMAAFLGQGGARQFLPAVQAAPGDAAVNHVSPAAAAANKSIFYGKDGQPRTVQQVYDLMTSKVSGNVVGQTTAPQQAAGQQTAQPGAAPQTIDLMATSPTTVDTSATDAIIDDIYHPTATPQQDTPDFYPNIWETPAATQQPAAPFVAPQPEPQAYIDAQVQAMADPNSTKRAVLVTPGSPLPTNLPPGTKAFLTQHGTVLTSDPQLMRSLPYAATDEQMGAAVLNWEGGRPPTVKGGEVVRALDANGVPVGEVHVLRKDVPKAMAAMQGLSPVGKAVRVPLKKALADRERLRLQDDKRGNGLRAGIEKLTKRLAVTREPQARVKLEKEREALNVQLRGLRGETVPVLTPEEQARAQAIKQRPALPPGQGFDLVGKPQDFSQAEAATMEPFAREAQAAEAMPAEMTAEDSQALDRSELKTEADLIRDYQAQALADADARGNALLKYVRGRLDAKSISAHYGTSVTQDLRGRLGNWAFSSGKANGVAFDVLEAEAKSQGLLAADESLIDVLSNVRTAKDQNVRDASRGIINGQQEADGYAAPLGYAGGNEQLDVPVNEGPIPEETGLQPTNTDGTLVGDGPRYSVKNSDQKKIPWAGHSFEDLQKALGKAVAGATIAETSDGHRIDMPNGTVLHVNRIGSITIDRAAARAQGHSDAAIDRAIAAGGAKGSFRMINGKGIIQLTEAGKGELGHELMHFARVAALTAKQNAILDRAYMKDAMEIAERENRPQDVKDILEEVIARAYNEWLAKRGADRTGMFAIIRRFFRGIRQSIKPAEGVFEKVASGEAWTQETDAVGEQSERTGPQYMVTELYNDDRSLKVSFAKNENEVTPELLQDRAKLVSYLKGIQPESVKRLKLNSPEEYVGVLQDIVETFFPEGADIRFRSDSAGETGVEHLLKERGRRELIETLPKTLKDADITIEFRSNSADKAYLLKKYFDESTQKDLWDVLVVWNNELQTKWQREKQANSRTAKLILEAGQEASPAGLPSEVLGNAPTGVGTDENIPTKSDSGKPQYSLADTAGATPNEVEEAQRMWAEMGTESPYFKKWFGDSKVVDENGKPMVVYHGTRRDFSSFELDKTGTAHDSGFHGEGFYFAKTGTHASDYAGALNGASIIPAYLSIKNPYMKPSRKKYGGEASRIFNADIDRMGGLTVTAKDNPRLYAKKLTALLKRNGYDGVILDTGELDADEIVAFSPTQIKSATGNRGTFDAGNPDIRYSLNTANPLLTPDGLPSETLIEFVVRKMQDRMNRLTKTVKVLGERNGAPLADNKNAALLENLYQGRTEEALRQIEADHLKPLIDAIQTADVTVSDVEDALYAMHAKRRNMVISGRTKGQNVSGSGITDDEADQIMDDLRNSGKLAKLYPIIRRVWNINKARLALLKSSGLESAETLDLWYQTYGENYVPLKNGADIQGGLLAMLRGEETPRRSGTGRGYDIRGRESKHATGRHTKAGNILANILADYETTIIRAEKLRVDQAFLRMVEDNPDPTLWEIDKTPTKAVFNTKTGEVEEKKDPRYKLADNVLGVKVNGEEHFITIKDEVLARAMKNLGAESGNMVLRMLAANNRFMSQINTALDPEFTISNLFRDLQTAGLNLTAEGKTDLAAKILKDMATGKPVRGIYRVLREKNSAANDEWSQWFDRFRKSGGKIGFFGLRSVEDQAKRIENMLAEANGGAWANTKKGTRAVLDYINDMNGAVENGMRLAVFRRLVEAGMSEEQAAGVAKELTVNFNKRGEAGTVINALYLFSNVNIQGTARLFKALTTSKRGLILSGALVASGVALAALNRQIGGEDDDGQSWYDKIDDSVKARNLILMKWWKNDGSYIPVMLPYGYNTFKVIGDQIEAVAAGKKTPLQASGKIVSAFVDAFNPLGSSGTVLGTFLPSISRPFVDIATNTDFGGNPIKPVQSQFGPKKPESQLAWSTAAKPAKWVAEELNKLTGGNEFESGKIDTSPEVIEHLWSSYTGGVARFMNRVVGLGMGAYQGTLPATKDIPFLRKVSGEQSPYVTPKQFREMSDTVKVKEDAYLAYRKTDPERAKAYRQDNLEELAMVPKLAEAEKVLKPLATKRNEIKAMDLSDAEKALRFKPIDEKIATIQKAFIRDYMDKGATPQDIQKADKSFTLQEANTQRSKILDDYRGAIEEGNTDKAAEIAATARKEYNDKVRAGHLPVQLIKGSTLRSIRHTLKHGPSKSARKVDRYLNTFDEEDNDE